MEQQYEATYHVRGISEANYSLSQDHTESITAGDRTQAWGIANLRKSRVEKQFSQDGKVLVTLESLAQL